MVVLETPGGTEGLRHARLVAGQGVDDPSVQGHPGGEGDDGGHDGGAGGLRDEGMAVDVAFDGQDALERVGLARYDAIVLDRDLPGVHGDQGCADLAGRRCPSRVLMLPPSRPSSVTCRQTPRA